MTGPTFTVQELETVRQLAEDGVRRHADGENRARVAGWPEDAEAHAEGVSRCLAVLEALARRPHIVTEAERDRVADVRMTAAVKDVSPPGDAGP